ncbi:MAG: glycine--tRNA ligase subunit beta [Wenzhouxiangella sp.]|nr:MAG: glycine--tRNA ligase subunit beta [Wenzhouxiangella sp.]
MTSPSQTAKPLLIELGCEELPARQLGNQLKLLGEGLHSRLKDAGLLGQETPPTLLGTPRRLAVIIDGVLPGQADRELERKGPAERAAFDADGQPTRAAEGFARSVGVPVDQLERLENEQGRWLFARVRQPGQALAELLPDMLDATVKAMAGARSMRWSDRPERFLRPVRWLLVLHGEEVVPVSAFGLESGRQTQGHRIHAPGAHPVAEAHAYAGTLKQAYVQVDPKKRRRAIRAGAETLARGAGLEVRIEESLLDEVAGLTEWPVPVIGSFDERFLEVPAEALISSMEQHQKCFPLRHADGRLAARFIAVANIESRNMGAMTAGFERVIRPRLADARFFFDQDRRETLEQRLPRLDGIKFQEKLGSVGAKSRRLQALAADYADLLGADRSVTARAALLSKCDLVTEMVGEFPELQGIMGRYYALADGEPDAVAAAIESHYLPRHAGDALPADAAGRALALADRLDTLVGVFAAGQKPRGGKDPFALRRAALGVIRILDDARAGVSLSKLIELAADHLAAELAETVPVELALLGEVEEFLLERLRSHAADSGIETNTAVAVLAVQSRVVADFLDRARAVQDFADDPMADSLIAANKRIANLLKQADTEVPGEFDRAALVESAERDLAEAVDEAVHDLDAALEQHDYSLALARLAALREPVDRFFDEVMVMCDDEQLRRHRLSLLKRLRAQFLRVADVARLGR